MKIYLNVGKTTGMVDNPCIETKIKKLYNNKLNKLLKKEKINNKDSKELELLKYALENFNFSALRIKCELNKIKSKNKILLKKKNDILTVTINNVQILKEDLRHGK